MPVSVEVFEGNERDFTTVKSQLDKLKTHFGVEKVVFVGDRGMVKSAQIEQIKELNWDYITGITKPQIEKLINDDIIQLELFDERLCEVKASGKRYILRKNPTRAAEIKQNLASKIAAVEALIMKQNIYLYEHHNAHVETAEKKIAQKVHTLKLAKYIDVKVDREARTLAVRQQTEAIDEYLKLAGCYVLITEIPENELSTADVHARYKDLNQVEDDFRNLKTEFLNIRPVFVRTEAHVRGHVFACSLALSVIRFVREKTKELKIPNMEVWSQLDKIQYQIINVENQKFKSLPHTLNTEQTAILKSLGIRLPTTL